VTPATCRKRRTEAARNVAMSEIDLRLYGSMIELVSKLLAVSYASPQHINLSRVAQGEALALLPVLRFVMTGMSERVTRHLQHAGYLQLLANSDDYVLVDSAILTIRNLGGSYAQKTRAASADIAAAEQFFVTGPVCLECQISFLMFC